MAVEKNIPFRIIEIDTSQFFADASLYKEGCDVGMTAGVPISASKEDHAIEVALNVQFTCESTAFIILEVKVKFEIEPQAFQELFITKKKITSVVIPVGLSRHLATLTVGTARGVLHERLSKSKLNGFVLPTIDLTKILESNIVLDKKEL
jgi:hypothetical protein